MVKIWLDTQSCPENPWGEVFAGVRKSNVFRETRKKRKKLGKDLADNRREVEDDFPVPTTAPWFSWATKSTHCPFTKSVSWIVFRGRLSGSDGGPLVFLGYEIDSLPVYEVCVLDRLSWIVSLRKVGRVST